MIAFGCYANILDNDECDGGGLELNPWLTFIYQRYLECKNNGSGCENGAAPEVVPAPPPIAGLRARDIRGRYAATEPSTDMNQPADGAWWYDATRPELTNGALGPIIHSFTVEDPLDLSVSRQEKIRARGFLLEGLTLGEIQLELVGQTKRSTRHLYHEIKRTLEDFDQCCSRSIEVYLDDCDPDAESGKRLLTDCTEFHVVEIEDIEPATTCGTVVSIMFSAAPVVAEPDAAITSTTTTALGEGLLPGCPATTEIIDAPEFFPKRVVKVDVELQPDGTLKYCLVNAEEFDDGDDWMVVRELRVASAVSQPCSTEVALDLTGQVPIVTPFQPTLYAELLATVEDGIDCTNQPIVREITIRNPDYVPGCPTCPDGITAAVCAAEAGLVVNSAGIIDWVSSGIDPSEEYVWTPSGGVPSQLQPLLNYWRCIGLTAASDTSGSGNEGLSERGAYDLQGYFNDADSDSITSGGGTSTIAVDPEGVSVQVDAGGEVKIKVGVHDGTGGINAINVNYVIRIDDFPGYTGDNPIQGDNTSCGPGEAEFIGSIAGVGMVEGSQIGMNGTATTMVIANANGNVTTYTIPGLVATTVLSSPPQDVSGGLRVAMNHTTDEAWSIAIRTGALTVEFDLYEGSTLAGTVSGNDWGAHAQCYWDVANNEMRILFSGDESLSEIGSVRADLVIASWSAGGILTEIDSDASLEFAPMVTRAMPTPSGGVFFATYPGGAQLNHWVPGNAPSTNITQAEYEFGSTQSMTPGGFMTYWGGQGYMPTHLDPVEQYSISEQDFSTVDGEVTSCSTPDIDDFYKGSGASGVGFAQGIAVHEIRADEGATPVGLDVYLIDHSQLPANDCDDTPTHCLPYITIPPSGTGPCLQITLATNGSATSNLSPAINDLSRARFEFGPCSAISDPACPGFVPEVATLAANTDTGELTPINWEVGFGWPAGSDPAQYVITQVDSEPNISDPNEGTTGVTVPIVDTTCLPPCGITAMPLAPVIPSDCWVEPDDPEHQIHYRKITGLNPARRYRPTWSVIADDELTQPIIYLWSGAAVTDPTLLTLEAFLCTAPTGHAEARIKTLGAGLEVKYDEFGLRIECGSGFVDANAGWMDTATVWTPPVVEGAETAYLIVVYPSGPAAPPTLDLTMTPIERP